MVASWKKIPYGKNNALIGQRQQEFTVREKYACTAR